MTNTTNANARGVRIYGATLAAIFVGVALVGISPAFVSPPRHLTSRVSTYAMTNDTLQVNTIRSQVLKEQRLSSRSGVVITPTYTPWQRTMVTWYSSLQGINGGTITATGAHVRDDWTCAVDPNVIPLGSIVEIRFADGTTHIYKAQDTGGAIRGAHIDVFMSDNDQCLRNGVQYAEYRIIDRR